MATLTVTTAADLVNPGDGELSLREAVQQANRTAAADTIVFAPALEGQTLTLTQGQLTVGADLAIDGDRDGDGSGVTIDGNERSRVLAIDGGAEVALTDLGITGGYAGAEEDGGGILLGAGGGLTLTGCTVSGNRAGYSFYYVGNGGGIFASTGSRVTIEDSTLEGNEASGNGGGIGTGTGVILAVSDSRLLDNLGANGGAVALSEGGSLALARSEVAGNLGATYHGGSGGGLYVDRGSVVVTASTLSGNTGYYSGGAIEARESTLLLAQATICGNVASSRIFPGLGGAVRGINSTIELISSTVTGNFGEGGIDSAPNYSGVGGLALTYGTLSLANSIVAGNFGADADNVVTATDLDGRIGRSNGHNIFGSAVLGDVAGDLEGIDPALLFAAIDPLTGGGVLALNGGPTPTVALRDAMNNPALSGAEPMAAGETDQRGFARPHPHSSNPDVGAFELHQGAISTTPTARNDVLTGTAGSDALSGSAGADLLLGLRGGDRLGGDAGGDVLRGGLGDDVLDGGAGQDTASFRGAVAAVVASLRHGTSSGAHGADRLSGIENLEGGDGADRLMGDEQDNGLAGRYGDDRLLGLLGDDRLYGERGHDLLVGGAGRDTLTGGRGADVFDYDARIQSPWSADAGEADRITDFDHGADEIDLSTLDARSATLENEAFTFLAAADSPFTAAGQVRWYQKDGETFVEANTGGTLEAELQIRLTGLVTLSATDFVL
jgi:Ca2+-binding RTX toxin-like protein